MPGIEFEWIGLDDVIGWLAKNSVTSPEQFAANEQVMAEAFRQVQQDTHIETGSLLLSEKLDFQPTPEGFESSITAGGESTGVHNPVDYAEIEMLRGGDHDFFRSLADLDEKLEQVAVLPYE